MKKENNEKRIVYIVYKYDERKNDIKNLYESKYPLEIVNKYGFNEKHFNDYILKNNDDYLSSNRMYNNMIIIKDEI